MKANQDQPKQDKPGQQQAQSGQGQQYGEGSYSGTKQYNEGLKKHMNQHDIEKEALDAAPRSEEEARQMEEAERVGRSKSKGEGESDDRGMGDAGVKRQGQ
jgi:hypothetical protein